MMAQSDLDLKETALKEDLKFYFMNPCEKYRARRQIPWKLALQILKILMVTTQVILPLLLLLESIAMMCRRRRSVVLGLCHPWILITDLNFLLQSREKKNTRKGVLKGKNNKLNCKSFLEILGQYLTRYFAGLRWYFKANDANYLVVTTKSNTVQACFHSMFCFLLRS